MTTLAIVFGSIVVYGLLAFNIQRRLMWYFSDPIDGALGAIVLAWLVLPIGCAVLLQLSFRKPQDKHSFALPPRSVRKELTRKELERENQRLERELGIR